MTSVTHRVPPPGGARARRPAASWPAAAARTSAYMLLFGVLAVLNLIGLVMVLSASSVVGLHREGSSWFYFLRQLVGVVGGLALFLVTVRIDYRRWRPPRRCSATSPSSPCWWRCSCPGSASTSTGRRAGSTSAAAAPAVGVRQARDPPRRRPTCAAKRQAWVEDPHRVLLPALVWFGARGRAADGPAQPRHHPRARRHRRSRCSSPPACPAPSLARCGLAPAARLALARHARSTPYRRARFFAFLDPWADPASHRLPEHPVAGVARVRRLARRRARRGRARSGASSPRPTPTSSSPSSARSSASRRLHRRRPVRRARLPRHPGRGPGARHLRPAARHRHHDLVLRAGVREHRRGRSASSPSPACRCRSSASAARRCWRTWRPPASSATSAALDAPAVTRRASRRLRRRRRRRDGRPRAPGPGRRRRARPSGATRVHYVGASGAIEAEARARPPASTTRSCRAAASSGASPSPTSAPSGASCGPSAPPSASSGGCARRSSLAARGLRVVPVRRSPPCCGGCRSSSPSRTPTPARPTASPPASPRPRAVAFPGTPLPRAPSSPATRSVPRSSPSTAPPTAIAAARAPSGCPVDRRIVLVAGGSLGARSINDAAVGLAAALERPDGRRHPPRRRPPRLGRDQRGRPEIPEGRLVYQQVDVRGRHAHRARRRRRRRVPRRARRCASRSPPPGCRRCSCRRRSSPATTRPATPGGWPTPAAPCWCPTPSSTPSASPTSSTPSSTTPSAARAMADAAAAPGPARCRRGHRRPPRGSTPRAAA